jgi:hypothetical protein
MDAQLAFYVNHPPGVALQSDKTIKVKDLVESIKTYKEDIKKSLNAEIRTISPYKKEPDPIQPEIDYKLIIIGSAIGVVLLLLLIVFVLW